MSSPSRRSAGASPVEAAGLTFPQALVLVVSELRQLVISSDLSEQTADKVATHAASMCLYMTDGLKKPVVVDVEAGDMHRWVGARTQTGKQPSVAVRHNRRNAARVFFRVLRRLGLFQGDPTLDIRLPARTPVPIRPLEEDELLQARFAAETHPGDTRLPAAVALGEAGLGSGELGRVRITDADPPRGRVWVPGTPRANARWAYLSAWGIARVEARVAHLRRHGAGDNTPLVYEGHRGGASAQSAACLALNEVLEFAGLAGEPGIKPSSFAASYARRIFDATQDLGAAASAIGRRNLDTTADLIGYDWKNAPENIREDQIRSAVNATSPGRGGRPEAARHRPAHGRRRQQPGAATAPRRAVRTVRAVNNRTDAPGGQQ